MSIKEDVLELKEKADELQEEVAGRKKSFALEIIEELKKQNNILKVLCVLLAFALVIVIIL